MIVSIIIWLVSIFGFGLVYIYYPMAATLLILSALILVPVLSMISAVIAAEKVRIELVLPDVVSKGQQSHVEIKVCSKTRLLLSKVKAEISLKNCLTDELVTKKLELPVKARGEVITPLEFQADICGFVECRVEQARAADFFNLLMPKVKSKEKEELIIVPDTFDITMSMPENVSLDDEANQYSQVKSGSDYSEVFQIRDYAEGDSPKQIHWKLSSKTDRLIARDPGLPVEKSIFVFWERSCCDDREDIKLTDAMAEVLVSLVRGILLQGISCRLAWNETGYIYNDITLSNEDELYSILPRLLKASTTGNESGAELFNRLNTVPLMGNIVYLASYEAQGLEEMGKGNNLIRLIEGETFSRYTYAEDLKEIRFC